MKRKKVTNPRKDARIFTMTADRTRGKNLTPLRPMRGGYRL